MLQLAELLGNYGRAVETDQRTFHRLMVVVLHRYVTANRAFLRFSEPSGDSPPPAAAGIVFRSPFLSVTLLEQINQTVLSKTSHTSGALEGLAPPQTAWKLVGVRGRPGDHMRTT